MEQSHGKLIKFYRKNKKKVSFHDIPNESKFIMKSGCISKQKKTLFDIFYYNSIEMRCFISVRAPVDTNCEFQRILYCHEIKEWKKCTTKATKKMFMISLSVTLNYFFCSWLLSFRLPNFIGCAIGKTENGSQQIHVSKLMGVRLCDDSIEYGKIE